MALQLLYDRPETGESYPNAYHRIMAVNLNMAAQGAEIVVGIYRDVTARAEGKRTLARLTVGATGDEYTANFAPAALDLAKLNPARQGYLYLKALATYKGATDV